MNWSGQRGYSGSGMLPPTVKALLIINLVVFLLQQVAGRMMTYYFGLIPALFWKGFIWQPVTYMFMHGGFGHIFFNMFALWMFGRTLEEIWGSKKFLIYYMICGVGAGLLSAAISPGSPIPTVGASGAVYGLLMAFGLLFPNQMIFIYFLFPIKAKFFVIGMIVVEFLLSFNPASPVAHIAHLGGMIFGFVYLKWPQWNRKIARATQERRSRESLKVVYQQREVHKREIKALQAEVDELLDKINREGLESLSASDKQRLKEASRKLKEWEEDGTIH